MLYLLQAIKHIAAMSKKFYIRYEVMGGDWYYMIYRKYFFGLLHCFWERWNTSESAITRINELN